MAGTKMADNGEFWQSELTRENVDSGVEKEVTSESDGSIVVPFDPENIDVITRTPTVELLLSRIRNGAIDLQPEFQRKWGIWTTMKQSRLIESLLLRIPLPTIYAAEDENENWEIVDGIQRLSTISRFIEPAAVGAKESLHLKDLEYLSDFEGATFERLPPKLQRRLREAELVVHLIRHGTPIDVKFNIFARINTGGLSLSSQELRHALVPGRARAILKELSSSREFIEATDNSVRDDRMGARELVLRFAAFYRKPYMEYSTNDLDRFLVAAMKELNELTIEDQDSLDRDFKKAMRTALTVFGQDAFRKRYRRDDARYPVNKALFEAVSVNVAALGDDGQSRLVERREQLRDRFIALCNERDFDVAISQGTGSIKKVHARFSAIERLFQDTLDDARISNH